jgi:hypothetical protein
VTSPSELDVYHRLINFLISRNWVIVCASPPAGTDNRFRKCLLPRRTLGGSERGPRDEVDLTAHNDKYVVLIECKSRLSQSLQQRNALSESDYQKLKRIRDSFSPSYLSNLLRRGTGIGIPEGLVVSLAIAVGLVDAAHPDDMTVFEFAGVQPRITAANPLIGTFS